MIKTFEVDKGFTKIDITISGMQFLTVVDSLVNIEDSKLGEISKDEIEDQLQKSATYQVNFVGALSHIRKALNDLELNYKIWYAKKSEIAKKEFIDDLIQMVEDGKITKGNVKMPSKGEVEDYIIIHYEEEFKVLNEKINEYRNDATTVGDYLSTLRKRGDDLRALLKQERDTENNSSGIIRQTNLEN